MVRTMVLELCKLFTVFVMCRFAHSVDIKSNVAFVIDDTASMTPVIEQVKSKVKEMFLTIYQSKTSKIEDFVLITFNDYQVFKNDRFENDFSLKAIKNRIITRDYIEFLRELNKINANGGGDCPELCLSGIQSAIQKCSPYSFIYVFTDASPRDHYLQHAIKNLAQQKSIQINFILVMPQEYCSGKLDFTIYRDIAKATFGEVFTLNAVDVNQVLNYVKHCLKSPQTTLQTVSIKPGTNKIEFTGDQGMNNISVEVSVLPGSSVELDVTKQDGNKAPTYNVVDISNFKFLVVPNPENGPYLATVNTDGTGETSIKAEVTVDFTHGFSTLTPSSMNHTSTRPVPNKESYLAIQLILTGTIDAYVESIHILDINNKEIFNLPATTVNETEKIYVSTPFVPPKDNFKIEIFAVDKKSHQIYKRFCRTPVTPQRLPSGKLEYKTPEVKIDNGPEIYVTYGESVKLVCRITAYPEPKIIWEDVSTGLQLPSKESILELPSEYISHLEINNINKNGTYQCKATSNIKEVIIDQIKVTTIRPRFFKILEAPKDTEIYYEKDAKIYCKIDAWPPGYVTWYKGDEELKKDSRFEISDDKTTLLIKKMLPELEGSYSCRATNEDTFETKDFTLTLSGDSPEIDKLESVKTVKKGSDTIISCRIVKGVPKPIIIFWTFKKSGTENFVPISDWGLGPDLKMKSASLKDAGVYRCSAINQIGTDSHDIELIVQYPPVVEKKTKTQNATKGTDAVIKCRILEGLPKPRITWKFRRHLATEFVSLLETDPEIHKDGVKLDDSGNYKCIANNIAGEDSHEIEFTVIYPVTVTVDKPVIAKIGETVTFSCNADGEPKPVVKWIRDGTTVASNKKYKIFQDYKLRFVAALGDEGNYTCSAENSFGRDYKNATLQIYGPIKLEVPLETTLYVDIGADMELLCKAFGLPQPKITWYFTNPVTNKNSEINQSKKELLTITNMQKDQIGQYICTASNGFDTKSVTYVVDINVPVQIEHPKRTVFHVMENDLTLRIPCKAKGYPKPKVSWVKNFTVIDMGGDYAMDSDGTLIISNPDSKTAGTYLCTAVNNQYYAFQTFTVKYDFAIPQGEPSETIYIEKGTASEIECKVPHQSTDVVRWYKNGDEIQQETNNLIFHRAADSNTGVYSCRVNSLQGSQFTHMKIEVGTKPSFQIQRDSETVITAIQGRKVKLDCRANGTPPLTVTWWRNGLKLNETNALYEIEEINKSHFGENRCEVKNNFGTITRSYVYVLKNPTDCAINYTERDENKFHPVVITKYGELQTFYNEDGVMFIPERANIELLCPNSVREVYCFANRMRLIDNTLPLEKRLVDYADLKCDSEMELNINEGLQNRACSPDPQSRLIQVGYNYRGAFYGVYDVCIAPTNQKLYFVKYKVTRFASDIKIDNNYPIVKNYIHYDYKDMFDCDRQRNIHGNGCCFKGKQILSPEDVAPSIQKITYSNLNIVPQWNFCGNDVNLKEIERRIRDLAKSIQFDVEVFGGEYQSQSYILEDRYGHSKTVPKYLWKVVIIRKKAQALAIVTINVPKLTKGEASKLVFCQDICKYTDWMKNPEWHNVSRGYTFCCDANEFGRATKTNYEHFGFQHVLLSKHIT